MAIMAKMDVNYNISSPVYLQLLDDEKDLAGCLLVLARTQSCNKQQIWDTESGYIETTQCKDPNLMTRYRDALIHSLHSQLALRHFANNALVMVATAGSAGVWSIPK